LIQVFFQCIVHYWIIIIIVSFSKQAKQQKGYLPSLSQTGNLCAMCVAWSRKAKHVVGNTSEEVKWFAYWVIVS
jgi:hypothetical protein